jgi:hypothetical protein
MNKLRIASLALAVAALPLAGGCSSRQAPAADDSVAGAVAQASAEAGKATTTIGKQVEREIAKARVELRTKDISLNHGGGLEINDKHYGGSGDTGPEASITPRGDLVVDGKTVAATPAQRAMLLEYRGRMIDVAEAGMAIGAKGADLAGVAVSEALGSIFGGGDKQHMEDRIEAKASELKEEAKLICTRLPALLDAQQKLAASMPEFRPYASMDQEDVDDCARDIDRDGAWSTK